MKGEFIFDIELELKKARSTPANPANAAYPREPVANISPISHFSKDRETGNSYGRCGSDQMDLAVHINRMVEAGVIPPGFTHRAYCCSCGDILLDYTVFEDLVACPWCFSSKKPDFEI